MYLIKCELCLTIHNGFSRTDFGALRFTATQVTLDDFTGIGVVVDGAVRTRLCADFATNAFVIDDFFCTGLLIDYDGISRAGVQTPGLFALGACIRHRCFTMLELKYLDTRLGRVEQALVFN